MNDYMSIIQLLRDDVDMARIKLMYHDMIEHGKLDLLLVDLSAGIHEVLLASLTQCKQLIYLLEPFASL